MMNLERWRQIDALLLAALERAPAERPTFLEDACSGDESLKIEVQSLLSSGEQSFSLIETPAFESAAALLSEHIPELIEGQLVGHYKILTFIGAGGMGEVYLARDEKLKRRIALKLLPADYSKHKDRLRRFQQEAQTASALNHPNILTIYEIGQIGDQQFIATEFVEGETLRERMKRGGLTLTDALDIAIQVAGALAAAHNAGIVHRDIKPENIMLRPDGYVKVVDFGLAKLTEQQERAAEARAADNVVISSGLMMGTVKYMSPEQARNIPVDPRSDIFSFGVVLYEMLTHRAPFKGETSSELIKSILKEEPAPITKFLPDAPVNLQPIVSKALNKDKAKRYQTAEDLLIDLKDLRQRLQHSLSRETIVLTDGDNLSGDGKRTGRISTVENVVSHIKRHRMRAALGFVASLAVIAIAIYPFRALVSEQRLSFEKAAVSKLPIDGKITRSAALSHDGKLVAYGVNEAGKSSLWLTLADGSGTPRQLTQAGDGDVFGVVFSGDGQWLFFNREENGETALFKIQIDGTGAPLKFLEHVDSRITLSPDDKQLAFTRQYANEGESVLIVTNADGTQERRIATRKEPIFFNNANGPAWSPDGKLIVAIIEGGSINESSLIAFEVEGGAETRISTMAAWPRFRDVAWLPDGGGLVLIVTEGGRATTTEIWQLSYPGWEPIKITDSEKFYESISVGKSSGILLAVERETTSDIWISPLEENSEPTQITNTLLSGRGGVCWTPNNKIVYHSRERGIDVLWRMNADGSKQQNLTPDSHGNFYPSVSAEGSVVFMSRRTGVLHVWRLDPETGRQLQLTGGSDEQFPQVSVDGKRVYYVSWDSGVGTVWQVSINGGQPSQVISESSYYPELSPDGKLLTYVSFENRNRLRKVVSLEGAQTRYIFHGPLARLWLAHWSRTGDALLYLDQRNDAWNVWSQPLSGGEPKQLTHFKEGRIYFFDESWDGQALVLSRGSESRELVLFKAKS